MNPAITFGAVIKSYGTVRAVNGVSFEIRPGEMVAMLGPNGAGKSTTVDILLGLRRPDSGTARVLGLAPQRAAAAGRVGAMLQSGSLPDRATVAEVIDLARRLYGSRRTQAALLDLAGLTDLASRRADRLSGGQARRVQLAVALAGEPEVLFLDEPTTGLDVQSRRLFWAGVWQVAATGATVLFATHYLDEADANADRVLVLAAGQLIADGEPASIKAQLSERTIRVVHPVRISELRALARVSAVTAEGPEVELRTTDQDRTLEGLYRCGATIRNLRIDGATLEDALIALTSQPSPPRHEEHPMIPHARFESRRTLRDTRFVLFLVAMPALLYLLLSGFSGAGTEDGLAAPAAFMVAMMCYAAIGSACYAIGPPLAQERASHWIRQLQIMPLRGTSWLAVKLIQGALLILPGTVIVAVAALITHPPGLTPARWAGLAVVLLAGSLPFTVLGLVIGQGLDGQVANSATLFTVLGLSFAGGLLIPDSQLPHAVREISTALPSRQLADLARAAAAGHQPSIAGAGILVLWTLALRRRDGAA